MTLSDINPPATAAAEDPLRDGPLAATDLADAIVLGTTRALIAAGSTDPLVTYLATHRLSDEGTTTP